MGVRTSKKQNYNKSAGKFFTNMLTNIYLQMFKTLEFSMAIRASHGSSIMDFHYRPPLGLLPLGMPKGILKKREDFFGFEVPQNYLNQICFPETILAYLKAVNLGVAVI
jgi:hypothetical protein